MSLSIKSLTTKALALTLATSFIATAALPVATAEAGRRDWKNHHQHGYYKKHRRHRGDNGDALAAGIIGFAIGAIIADQARPRTVYVEPAPIYVQPQPVYVPPQPVYREPVRQPYNDPSVNNYDEPRVIRYEDSVGGSFEPWTPEWAQWCDENYRSFNQNTGTFRGYDGLDHFCVVK